MKKVVKSEYTAWRQRDLMAFDPPGKDIIYSARNQNRAFCVNES